MLNLTSALTSADGAVVSQLDRGPAEAGAEVGTSARAGLASFLSFARRLGVPAAVAGQIHLPFLDLLPRDAHF